MASGIQVGTSSVKLSKFRLLHTAVLVLFKPVLSLVRQLVQIRMPSHKISSFFSTKISLEDIYISLLKIKLVMLIALRVAQMSTVRAGGACHG